MIITRKVLDFVAWMDKSSAVLETYRVFGKWHVHVSWKVVHSYSDDLGEHASKWSVTRTGEDLQSVVHTLYDTVLRITAVRA